MAEKNCKCGKNAFLEIEKILRCKSCFSRLVEKKVKKAISKYKMLTFNCHVAVGLSGGKDSSVLLTILKKILSPKTRITAVIIDEGIKGYRTHGVELAKQIAEQNNVPFVIKSYKSNFNFSLDEMLPAPFGKSSCAICGTFRRKALNAAVLELNADYLATGHNLDDEAETVLLNMVRGDTVRFSRQSRIPESVSDRFVPRIKPLVLVTQPEIVYYAVANDINYHDDVCPYASQARRNSIRNFLQNQEKRHPGTLINIISVQDKLNSKTNMTNLHSLTKTQELISCKNCNEPTDRVSRLCQACKFLLELKK